MRAASISRKTAETNVTLKLDLDGSGVCNIHTGVGFLDHMLTLFAVHGNFDLSLSCEGDTWVDDHHSVEDIAICLGSAFRKALGDKAGICRYGDITLPMDESLILAAVDISGRPYLVMDLPLPTVKVGTFDTELVNEFFTSFAFNAGITLHIRELAGRNTHHIIEGTFKAVARALRKAVFVDPAMAGRVPSSKGVLE